MDSKGMSKAAAAAKAGMSERTAREYRKSGKLPSEKKKPHDWRTRKDPFKDVWPWCKQQLELNPTLQATTLFDELKRRHEGKFQDGQLRTLQRRIKKWRATEGPPKEVYFSQVHKPGRLAESDFTDMAKLGVSVGRVPFPHLLYHFTLTYSNWEWATICFSESMESLSHGLQASLWKLGAAPERHRTDQLSAAVTRLGEKKGFTTRYAALMDHYGMEPEKTQPASPNENGDIEKRHDVLFNRLDQALMLRGSRNFESREDYEDFLHKILSRLNTSRSERFREEKEVLGKLPVRKIPAFKKYDNVPVSSGSLIRIDRNRYSVPSRLIGEKVNVTVHPEHLTVCHGTLEICKMPRLRGRGKAEVNWRHLIDGLVRKPGAMNNYRYREHLFPTSHFRMAYDWLAQHCSPKSADRKYLKILHLAARETESGVNRALEDLLDQQEDVSVDAVRQIVAAQNEPEAPPNVDVEPPDLGCFDQLYSNQGVAQ